MIPKGTLLIIGGAEDKGGTKRPEAEETNKNYKGAEILAQLLPKKKQAA